MMLTFIEREKLTGDVDIHRKRKVNNKLTGDVDIHREKEKLINGVDKAGP